MEGVKYCKTLGLNSWINRAKNNYKTKHLFAWQLISNV